MTAITPSIARAPTLLATQSALARLTRLNLDLLRVQTQLATSRRVNTPSDDAVASATILALDERLEAAAQRMRNLDHASSALSVLDQALGEASDLVLEAKGIASAQANFTASADERRGQAVVIDSLIRTLFDLSNRSGVAGHLFGGSAPTAPPVVEHFGGFRYRGQGAGLTTDLGLGDAVRLTLGVGSSVGAVSARVRGSADLTPPLRGDTRLADLRGAVGLGVTTGALRFTFGDGTPATIDLAGADTVQDVIDRLTFELRAYESDHGVTILGTGGVGTSGGAISIDVAPGGALRFLDEPGSTAATDLGLAGVPPVEFTPSAAEGLDTGPRLTWFTPVADVLADPLGIVRLTNGGSTRDVDLSGAATFGDVRALLEGAGVAVRVEINAEGDGLDVLNDLAAGSNLALSIAEAPGGSQTAARLGIRTLTASTALDDFNHGRGVSIIDGVTNPTTGLVDPALNLDFTIHLGDGRAIDIDLSPADAATVQTVLAAINAQAAAQGVAVPGDFEAGIAETGGGLTMRQNASMAQALRVEAKNNSFAAADLGLLDGVYDASASTLVGEDRARVRTESLFNTLIDLRDALRNNDTLGITLAGERLESEVDRLAQSRGLVGGSARRVEDEARRQEDQILLDETTRSNLRDLDYAEASVRFSTLQAQLTAVLQTTAIGSSRTLLDFLG